MNASGNDGESGIDDAVVVRKEGVEVEKTHETERFPVPAIVFSIRSEREEEVEVHLADRVPEGVSMDDIGFHPEYGSEFWSVEGRTLVFERDVAGGAEAETVYGLRGPDAEEANRFLGEPTIEVWTGGEDDSSFVSDINDQLTRSATFTDDENGENGDRGETAESEDTAETPDAMGGDAGDDGWMTEADEGDEGNEGDESDAAEGERPAIEYGIEDGRIEKIERGVRDEGSERGEDGERGDDGRGEGDGRGEDDTGNAMATTEDASMDENTPDDAETAETNTTDTSETDAIAAQLARELRTGNVDSEDREVLRDVLSPRESVSARIDHLRSQVNDVAAYADALEAFLDENGSGRTLVRQQSERLDALREDTETVTEQARENRADVEAIEGDVERVENDVGAFQEAVSDLDEEIERIDERFASIDERFEESEGRSAEVTERLDSVESHQEEIDERLGSLEASHESEMSDLREEMETRDERVSAVERSTEDMEGDVESLKAWRAQLAGALGGTDPGNAGATESTGNKSGSEES